MGAGQQIGTLMTAFMKLVTLKKVKKLQILQRVIIQTWSCPLCEDILYANILFWEHLGVTCFRPKYQIFL